MTFVLLFVLVLGAETFWNLFLALRNFRYYRNLRERGIPEVLRNLLPQGYSASREIDYSFAQIAFSAFSEGAEALVLGGFVFFGGLGMLCHWSVRTGGAGWGGSLLCLFVFLGAGALLRLPLDIYHDFVLEVRYGFGTGNLRVFVLDRLKSLGIQMGVMLPLFGVLVSLTAFPYWYLWSGLFVVGVLMLITYGAPQLLLPLFYTLKPLEDESLVGKIQSLLHEASLECDGVFLGNESQRSHHANAMVLGLGRKKRILLFDTLLETMNAEELLAITAHEIGHGVHRHVVKRLFLGMGTMFLLFLSMGILWEMPLPMDVAGTVATVQGKFLLLFLTVSLGGSFVSALLCPLYRREEFQADAYGGARVGKVPMMNALRKLATRELHWIPGDPFCVRCTHSHPSIAERLRALEEGDFPDYAEIPSTERI